MTKEDEEKKSIWKSPFAIYGLIHVVILFLIGLIIVIFMNSGIIK